jgi:N-acyl homoserine lactone hydrolase
MPNGLAPADPKAIYWRRPKTLAARLEQLGVAPSDINATAVSHTHPDHIGNVEMFPTTMLYVQKDSSRGPPSDRSDVDDPALPKLFDGQI